jgi:hypothetical protein
MKDSLAKAFDFAQETTKQLLTLSTAIITVTVTLIGTELKKVPSGTRTWLEVSWLFYLLCILFCVFTLMSLSGNLERPGEGKTPSIYSPGIRLSAILQVVTFLLALVFTVIFGAEVG